MEQAIRAGSDFTPMTDQERADLLSRTAPFAEHGRFERYKTTAQHDGTVRNPHWLTSSVFEL